MAADLPRVENLHLIVGLGNPGAEYAKTRHNAGFLVIEQLAAQWRANWAFEKKFNARVAKSDQNAGRALLIEPQTFMNASGEAVAALVSYYQVPVNRLLVIVDDADLPLGQLRLRPGGGCGGHHGLESIQQLLGTKEFARVRVGIGRLDGAREITGYVLGRFGSTETALLDRVLMAAARQAETWMESGIQKAMNHFNGAVGLENERKEQ